MKILQVPFLHFGDNQDTCDQIKQLLQHGAKAEINEINWREAFPKRVQSEVLVAHDNEYLYLLFQVFDEKIRANYTCDFEPVWQDSCVEFFMQREGETIYRNIECNILGALLVSKRESRDSSEPMTAEVSSIQRFTQIKTNFKGDSQTTDWLAFLTIPKHVLGFGSSEQFSGQNIRANFYKCGDETPEPHYISWNPIDLPKPDFHAPSFFGLLQLLKIN